MRIRVTGRNMSFGGVLGQASPGDGISAPRRGTTQPTSTSNDLRAADPAFGDMGPDESPRLAPCGSRSFVAIQGRATRSGVLTRMIHEDSHQKAGSAACGSLPVICARSHALRDSGRAKPRLRAQRLRSREGLSFSSTSDPFRRPGANPHE